MFLKSYPLHSCGQIYHNFQVIKAIEISELQCCLRELLHLPTGAHVMHIGNDDPENLFCLSFQTIPHDSKGTAHILEHTVLCGSQKFPVKDPFFAMNRRSLNTFMNALTGSDFTCYPAASQVSQDFYNLLEVYLDAVFRPILHPMSFLQEGHRLEFAIPDDPTTPLEFKGIVYNEMKGAMASGNARMTEAINHALFPDICYGYNSGGDPKEIPKLTYEELCDFHQKFYHPSRCLFFFYGSFPLERHLDFIQKHALEGIKETPQLSPIPYQPRFSQPRSKTLFHPISEEEDPRDKTLISFGWLTCHIQDQQELLALSILDIILMGTDASPLKMALLRSGYCKQAGSYLEADINELPFVIVLKGCNPEHADLLEELIENTLSAIVKEGISLSAVESAIHQLEIFRSEIMGDQAPFGLTLFMRSGLLAHHGIPAEEGLKIHTLFDQLRKRNIEDPQYLPGLIKKYFLDNSHRARVVMIPDKTLSTKESSNEKEILAKIHSELNDKQLKELVQQANELAQFQERQEEEDCEVLPKVTLDDVPKNTRDDLLIEEKVGNLNIFHHACFTNDIVYANLLFNLPEIAEEDLPYLRLMSLLMPQLGCGGRSYVENLEYIQGNTGGVGVFLSLNIQADDYKQFTPSIFIKGKALHRKANKLFPLMREMAESTHFLDIPRLKEAILKHHVALQSNITHNALRYAINLSASQLSSGAQIIHAWSGLKYLWTIRDLVKHLDQNAHQLAEKLQSLHQQVFCLENPDLIISSDPVMFDEVKGRAFYGLDHIQTRTSTPWKNSLKVEPVPSQGRIITSPIAYISKTFNTVSYTHPDNPALCAAAHLFDNLTLHQRVREQGGAYGAGASCNCLAGNFHFYSYRDPNICSTLSAFQESIEIIAEGKFEKEDLEEAKLEIFQNLDTPTSPGGRGERAYNRKREGKTLAILQEFRDRLISLTMLDIIHAVEKHIVPGIKKGATVVLAGKELLDKENAFLEKKGEMCFPLEGI